MTLEGANDMEKLKSLSAKTYKEQAIWFLNSQWGIVEDTAEDIWKYYQKFVELDEKMGDEGNELNEMTAHRFLEQFSETLTVRAMRAALKEIDIDTNQFMSMSEYLIYRYKSDWHAVVASNQKASSAELVRAEELCNIAKAKMTIAVEAANTARRAEADNRRALEKLNAEQKQYDDTAADLKHKSENAQGIVGRSKAANELAQHLNGDTTPLQRAKITQAATLRKAERARKLVEETENEAVAAFNEADEALKEIAARTGSAQGGVWWLQRELHEAKLYLPQSKGGGQ